MAVDALDLSTDRRYEEVRGTLFEYLLAGATMLGIVALGALIVVVFRDAIQPTTADTTTVRIGGLSVPIPVWYLVYLVTFVVPGVAFWRYASRRPPVAATSKRLLGTLVVGTALGLAALAVPSAVAPTDVAVYALAAGVPTLAVAAYGRANPSATWTGPGTPLSALAGLVVGWLLFEPIHAFVYFRANWVSFAGLVAAPAAALLGSRVADSYGDRAGLATAVSTLVGGVLAGVAVTGAFGISGPNSWLNQTVVTESFSTLDPHDAGVYPQIVGSILLVSVMAILVLPVGVGAAVYLEEYRYGVLAAAVIVLLAMNAAAIVLRNRYQREA